MEHNDLESKSQEQQSIVIVDDTPENLRLLVGILKERGYKIRPAPNGIRALATIEKEPPDLILLDIMMPEMNGYEVCRHLKASPQTCDIPVIYLSALGELDDKIKAFQAGGVDYISKPFQAEEVMARVTIHLTLQAQRKTLARQNEELKKKNALISEQAKKLELLARKDFLTGLSNRRDFLEKAKQEVQRFQRKKTPFCLFLLDLDHFKNINDSYGHECGDMVLVEVSNTLKNVLRAQDIIARWGGEEFVCLLPDTDTKGGIKATEKIRSMIESSSYDFNGFPILITATIGLCIYDGSSNVEACIRNADDALYKGKNTGRNQVVVSAGK